MFADFVASQHKRHVASEARHEVIQLIRPFLGRFEDWNIRAARASATILSHMTADAEKSAQRARLSELRAEIEAEYARFEAATKGRGGLARVADVDAAFRRLLAMLRRVDA